MAGRAFWALLVVAVASLSSVAAAVLGVGAELASALGAAAVTLGLGRLWGEDRGTVMSAALAGISALLVVLFAELVVGPSYAGSAAVLAHPLWPGAVTLPFSIIAYLDVRRFGPR